MNILHIGNKQVYPLLDGGCVAMASMLSSLEQLGTVDHIAINTYIHRYRPGAYPGSVNQPVPPEKLYVNTRLSAITGLKHLLKGSNYNLARFYSENIVTVLSELLQEKSYDLVVLESLFLASYVKVIRKYSRAKIVIRSHNIEHHLWKQQAEHASGMKRWYLEKLAASLQKEELSLLADVDEVWTITEEDAVEFRQLGIRTGFLAVPVAIELSKRVADYSNPHFFHIGSLGWSPNRLAVERLVTTLWPVFFRDAPSELHIAGYFSGKWELPASPGVHFHGFVDDIQDFMQSGGILATPIITGSGVRIKLLEAMSMGIPCITTALGAMGIEDPESAVCLAESDEEWIAAMKRLAGSEQERRMLGERSKEYIRKYHSFEAVNSVLKSALGS